MKNNISFEAPSTSRMAIVHDMDKFPVKWQDRVQFSQTSFAKTIHEVLDPQTLLVEMHHTIEDIERILNITGLAPSLLLGVKSLMGKTLIYDGMRVQIRETGTSFAVRSLNPEKVLPAKSLEVSVQQVGETRTRWEKLMSPVVANDGKFALVA